MCLDEILKRLSDKEIYDFGEMKYNENGTQAYHKLVSLLYDVKALTRKTDIYEILEELDNLFWVE